MVKTLLQDIAGYANKGTQVLVVNEVEGLFLAYTMDGEAFLVQANEVK